MHEMFKISFPRTMRIATLIKKIKQKTIVAWKGTLAILAVAGVKQNTTRILPGYCQDVIRKPTAYRAG